MLVCSFLYMNHIYAESCLLILYIPAAAPAAAKSLQSCPTLCNPTDGSPPGSPVPGVLQARTLEWVAISFSNAWKWKVKVKSLSYLNVNTTQKTSRFTDVEPEAQKGRVPGCGAWRWSCPHACGPVLTLWLQEQPGGGGTSRSTLTHSHPAALSLSHAPAKATLWLAPWYTKSGLSVSQHRGPV